MISWRIMIPAHITAQWLMVTETIDLINRVRDSSLKHQVASESKINVLPFVANS